MALPLNFPSISAELNLLSILSLLNFASGYRVPLHQATGRGAFDSIRAFVFSLYISSSVRTEDDLLCATGMQNVSEGKVAELMGVADKIHIEKPHPSLPAVKIGELGGPIYELVQLITKVMNETGGVLVKAGYYDLGAFVLEALKEGDKAKGKADSDSVDPECDVIVERVIIVRSFGRNVDADTSGPQLVKAIPAFQDMSLVAGERESSKISSRTTLILTSIVSR